MHVLFVTYRAYPFGGGEEDVLDKARWVVDAGGRATWLSHATSQGAEVTTERVGSLPGGVTTVLVPAAAGAPAALRETLSRLDIPAVDVIYVIGRLIATFAAAEPGALPAPWIAAYHYWTHLVTLASAGQPAPNVAIRARAPHHRLAPEWPAVLASAARVTLVSRFMQRVLLDLKVCVPTVIASPPTARTVKPAGCAPYDPSDPGRTWVVFFNAHILKHGGLLQALIASHRGVPVRAFYTEAQAGAGAGVGGAGARADAMLDALCARNDPATDAPVRLETRTDDVAAVLAAARLVVCASVVDETFGRVAAVAMAAGVPVVLSRAGNLPYLGGDDADGTCYVNTATPAAAAAAATTVAALWANADKLRAMSAYGRHRAGFVDEAAVRPQFHALLQDVVESAAAPGSAPAPAPRAPRPPRIMFFVPWHDQGLGLQARAYVRALDAAGVSTAVLSFTPYLAERSVTGVYRADPAEWVHPRLYDSPHVRERVTDEEVLACVDAFGAAAFVVPETCWPRVFSVAELLRRERPHVRVVGIPNIELVRTDELPRHAHFHVLLANNALCQRLLHERADVTQHAVVPYLGFVLPGSAAGFRSPAPAAASAPASAPPPARAQPRTRGGRGRGAITDAAPPAPAPAPLTLVLFGGYCLDGRKQGPAIVNALAAAARAGSAIHTTLRVTLFAQTHAASAVTAAALAQHASVLHDVVTLTVRNQTHAEVMAAYAAADVALLPTKHEGLGMGFYEALSAGCPVLTVDAAPHNEIVTAETGWLLPCASAPLAENTHALLPSAIVDADALRAWFRDAAARPAEVRARRAHVAALSAAAAANPSAVRDFGSRLFRLAMGADVVVADTGAETVDIETFEEAQEALSAASEEHRVVRPLKRGPRAVMHNGRLLYLRATGGGGVVGDFAM